MTPAEHAADRLDDALSLLAQYDDSEPVRAALAGVKVARELIEAIEEPEGLSEYDELRREDLNERARCAVIDWKARGML